LQARYGTNFRARVSGDTTRGVKLAGPASVRG
jgi:hypothetical protein